MLITKFKVAGKAVPKGSMKAFVPKGWNRAVLTSTNKSVKTWEQLVRQVAQDYTDAYTIGPVRVRLRFALPRPQRLSPGAPLVHIKRPDIDKLARAVLDALTGVLWRDDSQVCSLSIAKMYALPTEPPHLNVTVYANDAD